MKDPIKIIHKFKNDNKKIQYKVYIYIGNLVPDNIIKILVNITNKNLYDTLNTITNDNYKELENYYGEFWYQYFFINYHIYSQFKIIENNTTIKNIIEKKFGSKWYDKHIKNPPMKKIQYSYAANYYNYLLYHNKIKVQNKKGNLDFRTHNIINIDKQIGGEEDYDDDDNYEDDNYNENIDENIDENIENIEFAQDIFQEEIEEDLDIDEIAKLYNEIDIDTQKKIQETSKLISQAIHDKKWEKEVNNLDKKYDTSLDNLVYDTKIEDIYNKYYIYDQYIFKDDTIKTMRQKITVSIPISNKFGENIRLLPETLYFWSEYYIDNMKDFIMLGQKWIRKNELLKIDIIPNENIKIYEGLKNNLGYLKDNINYKIKREDDEANLIRNYENYITTNEIYMIDIYNELGLDYNPEPKEKRNLYDVYINIYFPYISFERLEQIINLLRNINQKELQYIDLHYGTIKNDNKLEVEIENIIESSKLKLDKYDNLFHDNFITQSIIHVNMQDSNNITGTNYENKFNLYRIFDNFIVDDKYPFIQYQPVESQITYKFYTNIEKLENQDTLIKWFENAPYGISFKIKVDNKKNNEKYMSINFHESGRIEYKITWKEEDEATMDDITNTYNDIRDLLTKINSENKKIKFILPDNSRFKYAFINTIQKFKIPDKFKINHNDLSEFSRLFFNYVSLVIEPKKRVSKKSETKEISSKYGTYLRYKRIAKYDNRTRIHLRILFFIKNFELTDRELIDEIAKQFNITMEMAAKELDYVREKYKKMIRKSRKTLKTLANIPKSKPPGIGIDIQGREVDKYKIRINGARNKEQLDEIISFMKVLLSLYFETYLYKNQKYQKYKELLKSLHKIAKRRNKVIDIVDYDTTIKDIKVITALDKARLGFKPDKGQNQWSRSCQNSGTTKIRRPLIISEDQVSQLIKNGYKLNSKTGYYEKEIDIKIKGEKYKTIIKAIKLSVSDNTYNFYTCDPSQNNEYMHIGFLSKSSNPNDLCMPCCYKKDFLISNNKAKKEYFLKCINEESKDESKDKFKSITLTDKLYILQETNKIQENRFIYLPKYLDIFFNKLWNHDHKIKNHYLYKSESGFFFKFTIKHDKYMFLSAISNIYEIGISELLETIINFINNDTHNIFYTYLNNGDIAESFKNKQDFIEYIKNSNYLEYDIIGELIAIPGVISKHGIKYYILNKEINIIKKVFEKEVVNDKYYLDCLNIENYNIYNDDMDIVILIKEDKYYFPIYMVKKTDDMKKIKLEKYYRSNSNINNIINELEKYHNKSCKNNIINNIVYNYELIAKNLVNLINDKIICQYIDDRHKCLYLELNNNLIIPTIPSGISYKYKFKHIKTLSNKWLDIDLTLQLLDDIEKILQLNYIPKIIYHDDKKDNNVKIVSILLNNGLIIPIQNKYISEIDIKNKALGSNFLPLEETINKEIINYNNEVIYDLKSINVKEHTYNNEGYNLYKLELSLFLNNNELIKNKIIDIVRNSDDNINDKKHKLRKILFFIIDNKLFDKYKSVTNDDEKNKIKIDYKMLHIVKKTPDLKNYMLSNLRDYCEVNNDEDKCNNNYHCIWKNNTCKFQTNELLAIKYVNKVIEEMIQNDIKFKEILQENNYYVSDIIDYTQYTHRNNQKIIKTTNYNINKIMSELFGKDKIPIIGRKFFKTTRYIFETYPELMMLGKQFIQEIIPNKDSIIRSYVNCYYWLNNPLYDDESRNLGYISDLQTNLTYLFKANIIDFIQDNLHINFDSDIKLYLLKYFKIEDNFFNSQLNNFRKSSYNTNGKIELYILSYLYPYPIIVYDNFLKVKYLFMQGEIELNKENIKNFTSDKNITKSIILKFNYNNSIIPKNIYSIYNK